MFKSSKKPEHIQSTPLVSSKRNETFQLFIFHNFNQIRTLSQKQPKHFTFTHILQPNLHHPETLQHSSHQPHPQTRLVTKSATNWPIRPSSALTSQRHQHPIQPRITVPPPYHINPTPLNSPNLSDNHPSHPAAPDPRRTRSAR